MRPVEEGSQTGEYSRDSLARARLPLETLLGSGGRMTRDGHMRLALKRGIPSNNPSERASMERCWMSARSECPGATATARLRRVGLEMRANAIGKQGMYICKIFLAMGGMRLAIARHLLRTPSSAILNYLKSQGATVNSTPSTSYSLLANPHVRYRVRCGCLVNRASYLAYS
jgi:hypothetical protein